MNPQCLIIHHSATKDGGTNDWDAIRRYHMSWRYQGKILTPKEGEELLNKGVKGFERTGTTLAWEGRRAGRKKRPQHRHTRSSTMSAEVKTSGRCSMV
jgi:hypothetical protein